MSQPALYLSQVSPPQGSGAPPQYFGGLAGGGGASVQSAQDTGYSGYGSGISSKGPSFLGYLGANRGTGAGQKIAESIYRGDKRGIDYGGGAAELDAAILGQEGAKLARDDYKARFDTPEAQRDRYLNRLIEDLNLGDIDQETYDRRVSSAIADYKERKELQSRDADKQRIEDLAKNKDMDSLISLLRGEGANVADREARATEAGDKAVATARGLIAGQMSDRNARLASEAEQARLAQEAEQAKQNKETELKRSTIQNAILHDKKRKHIFGGLRNFDFANLSKDDIDNIFKTMVNKSKTWRGHSDEKLTTDDFSTFAADEAIRVLRINARLARNKGLNSKADELERV
ncbi:MAG: hypothetical protein MN733_43575, partial [Nitrososphaera sp.]|nr:hypothetical protein [Nitrososphaera sp.]